MSKNKAYNDGHRERMRSRFFESSGSGFLEQDILEMCLFYVYPRKDVKDEAKELLLQFKNIANVIMLDEWQMKSAGLNHNMMVFCKLMQTLFAKITENKIDAKNVISSWDDIIQYLRLVMGSLTIEEFRVIYLDARNSIIANELLHSGTVDQSSIHIREIMKHAIINSATSMILVHNHPSSNLEPSQEDIDITMDIIHAARLFNVGIFDHLIIGRNGHYSMKSAGLI
jgi:DNA repair protein RadC